MKNKLLRGIFFNPQKNELKVKVFSNTLDEIYRLINCDCITTAVRRIGGHRVVIVCDDEGLLKPDNDVAIVTISDSTNDVVEQIVGNVLIVGEGDEDFISLTEEEIEDVLEASKIATYDNRKILIAHCD